MGGRGRGRGQPVSFNIEQLGFTRGGDAIPTSRTQPNPLYPSLENRAQPLIKEVEQEYILVAQNDFIKNKMMNSPYYICSPSNRKNDEENLPPQNKELTGILWNCLPLELKTKKRSAADRLCSASNKHTKKKTFADPNKILEKLEAKEVGEEDEDEDGEKNNEEGHDSGGEERPEIDEEGEAEPVDEEMDEGTDYCNQYFDNGEGYIDEDIPDGDDEATY